MGESREIKMWSNDEGSIGNEIDTMLWKGTLDYGDRWVKKETGIFGRRKKRTGVSNGSYYKEIDKGS